MADVYVLVDETHGQVAGIEHDRVVRITEQAILDQGYARAGDGGLFWFNGDYPLYYFMSMHMHYDYYIQLEYDVVLNTNLDEMMRFIISDKADFVGLTKGDPPHQWQWLATCADTYGAQAVRHQLICISVFSRQALCLLARRRLELSKLHHEGAAWPFCEGFIATEIALNGLRACELSRYGSTECYDHWPPFVETDLPGLKDKAFVHPVLDQQRYIASMFRWHVGLSGFLNPNSLVHRKLRRLPAPVYLGALGSAFVKRVGRSLGFAT